MSLLSSHIHDTQDECINAFCTCMVFNSYRLRYQYVLYGIFLTGYAISPDLNSPVLSRGWHHHQGVACWNKWPESQA